MSRTSVVTLDRVSRGAAVLFVAGAIAASFVLPLDGVAHGELAVLAGRFHPIVLHVPVTLLGLAPFFEILGHKPHRRHLRDFAGICLALGTAGAALAVSTGFLLAYGSGLKDPTVTAHMWGGIALTSLSVLALLVRRSWIHGKIRFVYPALLLGILGTLAWAAHKGGSVTHGETYLTDPLPSSVKKLLHIPESVTGPATSPDSAYALTVAPIFENNCLSCHNASKVKGGLRLDSFARLMAGGQHGAEVVPGSPEASELVKRLKLPATDPKVMPADGKPLLSEKEIKAIEAWIAAGASPTSPPAEGTVAKAPESVPDYTASIPEIMKAEAVTGAKLVPLSKRPGDGLILRTRGAAKTFDDAALARFVPFAPSIVDAELADTKVTDASFATLARFANIRAIRLENTAITGIGADALKALKKMSYLNLSHTRLTGEALATLEGVPHLYVFETPARPPPPPSPEPEKPAKAPMKAATAKPADPVFAAIEPVFAKNCIGCHGPAKTKGGLRLDTLAGISAGGKNGPVFTAGKPEGSELLRRVGLPDSDKEAMPPSGKPRLSAEQIATIKNWITTVKN